MTVDVTTWFKPGSPESAMKPFLGFAGTTLVVVSTLIVLGRGDLALIAAWSAMIAEFILVIARKVRLKIPLGLILTLYGPALILLVAGLRAAKW